MSMRQEKIIETYEKGDRFLNKEFVDAIPWADVKKYPIDERFFPILVYMRDVEAFTDIYYRDLLKTPTGRDPIIRRFMDKWQDEEMLHAELLDRFLEEAGYPTDEKWLDKARAAIPGGGKLKATASSMLANLIGKRFSAVHMTWGAINELSTLQGYKRVWETANHPVLEHVLRGIAREESSHIFFYRSIARLQLHESKVSRKLARFIIERLWQPVGSGLKTEEDSNYVVRSLFTAPEGFEAVKKHINGSIESLPGFEGTKVVTDRIGDIIIGGKKQTA